MRHAAVKDLFGYWNDLRGERTAPEHNELDMNAIRHVLADTFLLDIDEARQFPFLLMGTRLDALLGGAQKGRSFLDIWHKNEAQNLASVLISVADGACPVVAGAVTHGPAGTETALEMLILPVRHQGKTHSRLLGILTPIKAPAWLGESPAGEITLRSLRVVDDEEARSMPARKSAAREVPLFRDRRDNIIGKQTHVPFLQVIEGGAGQTAQGLSHPHHRLDAFR